MDNIGVYIKKLRTERGMTQEELGKLVGVKKAAVQKWESGAVKNLKRETIARLAEFFGVSAAAFVEGGEFAHTGAAAFAEGGELPHGRQSKHASEPKRGRETAHGQETEDERETEQERESSNISAVYLDGIYKIPVFESVSAGFGAYADSMVVDYVPLLVHNSAEVPLLMGLKVQGDSMYPKIEDGDIIVVRKQNSVDSGSIAVVLIDGEEGVVKKVEYGADWIDLVSINPEYKTRRFEGEEVLRLRVLGLVKQIVKMV